MAAALSVDDFKRHSTALMVVFDVYPQIMREMIVNIFPPLAVLRQIQNEPNQTFMKQLSPKEKKMILKLDSTGYNGQDVSCLYKLIRYFNLLPPPTKGWGPKPKPGDQCEGDDVERMKKNRNDIIHRPRGGLSECDGNYFFKQSIEIAQRMDSRNGSPQNGFESKIEDIQSYIIVSQEHGMKVFEKCPDLQEQLQESEDAPCIRLYYGNDIVMKIGKNIENENNDESSSACTMFLKNPNFDVDIAIEMLEAAKKNLCKEKDVISYTDAENGSLNLYISIPDRCFVTKEVLHKAIRHFLHDIFRTAFIKCIQGHTYTVVLATSTDLVSDNELTKQGDVDYLKEQQSPILKLNVKVKDSAFQNKNVLYREVNRFVSGVYNTLDRYTNSSNGSSREVLMLTANECDENCTLSLKDIEDPPQLR
ncbi:Hypothetical predicted protein [Mytilus galloprovincialis]|uniref:DZIP3-like HEPN domain-containing protein n=1 Tax=Mytilus galloprovincialis TaxID=29158 RepID=A0A8B6CRL8_MYTGA|nr:Hypothetical predicted protein [Mytilus galloprovincialis]